jgi:hypothetical protein
MSLDEISADLAEIRQSLSRHYHFSGVTDDQSVLAEAIALLAAAEERVRRVIPALESV